jgi:hypothetical protein
MEDLALGEKGIAEMLAPVLIRRLTLYFSIVNIAQSSSGFMMVTGAWDPSSGGRLWPWFPADAFR